MEEQQQPKSGNGGGRGLGGLDEGRREKDSNSPAVGYDDDNVYDDEALDSNSDSMFETVVSHVLDDQPVIEPDPLSQSSFPSSSLASQHSSSSLGISRSFEGLFSSSSLRRADLVADDVSSSILGGGTSFDVGGERALGELFCHHDRAATPPPSSGASSASPTTSLSSTDSSSAARIASNCFSPTPPKRQQFCWEVQDAFEENKDYGYGGSNSALSLSPCPPAKSAAGGSGGCGNILSSGTGGRGGGGGSYTGRTSEMGGLQFEIGTSPTTTPLPLMSEEEDEASGLSTAMRNLLNLSMVEESLKQQRQRPIPSMISSVNRQTFINQGCGGNAALAANITALAKLSELQEEEDLEEFMRGAGGQQDPDASFCLTTTAFVTAGMAAALEAPAGGGGGGHMIDFPDLSRLPRASFYADLNAQRRMAESSSPMHFNQQVYKFNRQQMDLPALWSSSLIEANAVQGFNPYNMPSCVTGGYGSLDMPGTGSNQMQIRCKFGQLGTNQGMFNAPHGFCLGLNEEIIVADTNNHRVQVFSTQGHYGYQFGSAGKDEGFLWFPRKIAVVRPSGNFVICDRGGERSRMQIFSPRGHFVRRIAIRFIDIVAGLAISKEGHIVAVDSVTPTVFIISEKGDLIRYLECSDFMTEPSDIAVWGSEYYICDFKGHSVVVISEDGSFLRRIGSESMTPFPNGIDISDAGDVLIGDSHGNQFHVAVFSNQGHMLSQFTCPNVKVSRCCGLKITSDGFVVTLAKNNHHVLVLNTLYVT